MEGEPVVSRQSNGKRMLQKIEDGNPRSFGTSRNLPIAIGVDEIDRE